MSSSTLPGPARPATTLGIACGAGAGALWGLVFLMPELLRDFSPLHLTVGRYLAYGAIAVALVWPRWSTLRARLSRSHWWSLAWLALAGNTVYYLLLGSAVQLGGIAMTSLVIGFLPVAVTVVGSRDPGAVRLRRLAPSLLLCVAGAICIGWQALGAGGTGPRPGLGLLCAIGALVSWTLYAIGNTRCLRGLPQVSSQDWNLLTGVFTGAQSLALLPLLLVSGRGAHDGEAWLRYALVCSGVALLASLLGNALWNRMTRLLPMTLLGQMILFETLFALLYGWLWEARWPLPLEIAALLCVVLGVASCVASHREPAPLP